MLIKVTAAQELRLIQGEWECLPETRVKLLASDPEAVVEFPLFQTILGMSIEIQIPYESNEELSEFLELGGVGFSFVKLSEGIGILASGTRHSLEEMVEVPQQAECLKILFEKIGTSKVALKFISNEKIVFSKQIALKPDETLQILGSQYYERLFKINFVTSEAINSVVHQASEYSYESRPQAITQAEAKNYVEIDIVATTRQASQHLPESELETKKVTIKSISTKTK